MFLCIVRPFLIVKVYKLMKQVTYYRCKYTQKSSVHILGRLCEEKIQVESDLIGLSNKNKKIKVIWYIDFKAIEYTLDVIEICTRTLSIHGFHV